MMLKHKHIMKPHFVTYRKLCTKILSPLTQRYDNDELAVFRKDLASHGIWTLPRVYLSTLTVNTFLLVIALMLGYKYLFFPVTLFV